MSSFLPEGGCYELLTIIGNGQGCRDFHAPRDPCGSPSMSTGMCIRGCQLVTGIVATGLASVGLCRFPSKYGKEMMLSGKDLFCNFFLFVNTSGVLGHSRSKWLAEKKLIGEKS